MAIIIRLNTPKRERERESEKERNKEREREREREKRRSRINGIKRQKQCWFSVWIITGRVWKGQSLTINPQSRCAGEM